MQLNSSPSVNIIRDAEQDMYYIPTANAREVYDRIATQFKSGTHSFNIIGSYGTGKSAFLWAFAKHLKGEKEFFAPVNGQFNACKNFKFINIIGEANSLVDTFARQFDTEAEPEAILNALQKEHKKLSKDNICLVIIVDEFGKFLEYAAKENPDKELYFVQQLAELANHPTHNILFLTSLHQNFDAYALGLSNSQRQEWEKVKGRLKELTFNEPVEQLLNILTVYLVEKKLAPAKPLQVKKSLLQQIHKTGVFNLLNNLNEDFSKALYPFDVLSAMVLAKALQRYGQNERSLFHFLSTNEYNGLYDYDKENNPFFNLNCVYDYLHYNYYTELTSRYNPDYFRWTLLRNSLDSVEVRFSKNISEAQKLVKTIGLLNLFVPEAAKIDNDLIIQYAENCLNAKGAKKILDELLKEGIIHYQKYRERYILFQGTDINIDRLIEEKKREIEVSKSIVPDLQEYFRLDVVLAKAITLKKGTPRFFKFKISDEPIPKFDDRDGAIDGFINIVFNEKIKSIDKVKKEPILYGLYQNTESIRNYILDIKASEKALDGAQQDSVAKREINQRKDYQINALNVAINEEIFKESNVKWFFDGNPYSLKNKRTFNKLLSQICEKIYPSVPRFGNELMNKNKVSGTIHTARKIYFQHLISKWNQPDIGFDKDRMPPEKTVYKTLLENTGIHINTENTAYFAAPSDASFSFLWEASLAFLESAKTGKRSIGEFIRTLSQKPFKLKKGFIDFWVPTFLFIRREEFELYENNIYVPDFTKELTDLFPKQAKKYAIKTFNIAGIQLELFNKYRTLVNVSHKEKITNTSFKELAKPFIIFYKQLPRYTQNTKELRENTKTFRGVIKDAKELEKTFFEQMPNAFGTSAKKLTDSPEELDFYIKNIQESIKELRTAFSALVNRIEEAVLKELGYKNKSFEQYVSLIKKRYASLKVHLLQPHQKVFYTRLNALIESREDWIKNIAHASTGKKLEDISDSQEIEVKDKLIEAFRALDNLIELGKSDFDDTKSEAVRIQMTGYQSEPISKNIIISAEQQKEVTKLEQKITKLLSKDHKLNQAVLAKLLKKYLEDDKS